MGFPVHVSGLSSIRASRRAALWTLGYRRNLLCSMLLSVSFKWFAFSQTDLSASSDSASTTRIVSGQIVNAATGLPVPRALVRMNTDLLLADSEGRFEFRGVTSQSVSLSATKPGFYASLDPTSGNGEHQVDLIVQAGPIEVRLYPEAVIAGTVIAPNGDPLAHVAVQALRDATDDAGGHWEMSNQTTTNERGEFRMPVPAGDYSVQIPYTPRISEFPEAVLPVSFPPLSSSNGSSALHMAAGSEERLELRPELRTIHAVRFRVDALEAGGYPAIEARWNNEATLEVSPIPASPRTPGASRSSRSGEFTIDLPEGDYMLVGRSGSDAYSAYGETHVLVADKDVDGVVLRLARQSDIPVSLLIEPASMSDNAEPVGGMPNIQQFGLWMRSNAAPGATSQTYYLTAGAHQAPAFHVPPGSYRVRVQPGGTWFVQKITAGSADLLSHNLEVAPGASGEGVQVTVSSQTGSVKGTVKLDGKATECAIVLIATTPSASPILFLQSGIDGSFGRTNVAPGSYLAIGFETRPSANLLSPEVQAQFSTRMKTVQVTASEAAEVELDAVPASELKP